MIADWIARKTLAAAVIADGAIVDERILICVLDFLVLADVKELLPRRCQFVLWAEATVEAIAEI